MTGRALDRVAGVDPRALWRAVGTEIRSFPRPLWAWFGLLGSLLLVGAASAIRALFPGDKAIGTTPSVEWGVLIVGYVFFAVTTSGLCLASSLGTVFGIDRFRPLEKRHAVLAVLCLVTAFGVIALDLHYPVRLVFGAVFDPSPSSPMWWMGVFYGIYLCFLLVEVWSIFWERHRIHGVACFLASAMAIIAPCTLGAVFGVLASRPAWNGVFTPLQMVVTALTSGTALLGIVFYVVHRLGLAGAERGTRLAIPAIRLLLTIGLLSVGLLLARQVAVGLLGSEPGQVAAAQALVAGPLAPGFWGLRVAGGLVVPIVLMGLPATRTPAGLMAASVLSIVGVFVDRLSFVADGQIAPTTAVAGTVSVPYAAYTPSPVEIGILVGAVAFIASAYTLAERYLDLRESEVHVGIFDIAAGWIHRGVSTAGADEALPAESTEGQRVGPSGLEPVTRGGLEVDAGSDVEPGVGSDLEPAVAPEEELTVPPDTEVDAGPEGPSCVEQAVVREDEQELERAAGARTVLSGGIQPGRPGAVATEHPPEAAAPEEREP